MMNEKRVIITRHDGAVEWLRQHGIFGKVIAHASEADVIGKDVVGILPLHLAALANSVTAIVMDLPPELRGKDITPEQMDDCGAKLVKYEVRRVEK